MFDAYATEMTYRLDPAPATPQGTALAPADAPDAAAIEQIFQVRRDIDGR